MTSTLDTNRSLRRVFALALVLGLATLPCSAADVYKIAVVAGNGNEVYSGDGGPALQAGLGIPPSGSPVAICVDSHGNLYFTACGYIRKVDTSGVITRVAGNGKGEPSYSGEGGPAIEANLDYIENVPIGLQGVHVDDAGNLYIAGWFMDLYWKVDTAGVITTVGGAGYTLSTNTWLAERQMMSPRAYKVRGDLSGSIYFVSYAHIEKIDSAGTRTRFKLPVETWDFCVDDSGTMYTTNLRENCVYAVDGTGKARLVAGNGAKYENSTDRRWYAGDGGPAVDATLKEPWGIAVDGEGNLFIADQGNGRVRMVDTRGVITTIAGSGYFSVRSAEGGPATGIKLMTPAAICVDKGGTVYFIDRTMYRIFKLYK